MTFNTVKTIFGFVKSLVGKYTPLESKADSLEDIYNYLPIDDEISTSGQPTEKQFELIKSSGFNHVINLAPHDAENSLKNEKETLSELDMTYNHIPVDFSNPTDEDFSKFVEVMSNYSNTKVWVHCAANMRVSAFIYRYRCRIKGEPDNTARIKLAKIWEPYGVWKKFVS